MDYASMKAKANKHFNSLKNLRQPLIHVGMGTCGKAAGAEEVFTTVEKSLKKMITHAVARVPFYRQFAPLATDIESRSAFEVLKEFE